ncbi:MAG: hypothetical protein Q4P72_02925 [Eubacteriales bacterium]|nr:hypothetical protein [Eubacteriales bacterium]
MILIISVCRSLYYFSEMRPRSALEWIIYLLLLQSFVSVLIYFYAKIRRGSGSEMRNRAQEPQDGEGAADELRDGGFRGRSEQSSTTPDDPANEVDRPKSE